jgi:hypothetical protein
MKNIHSSKPLDTSLEALKVGYFFFLLLLGFHSEKKILHRNKIGRMESEHFCSNNQSFFLAFQITFWQTRRCQQPEK